jgi:hypothetical protein
MSSIPSWRPPQQQGTKKRWIYGIALFLLILFVIGKFAERTPNNNQNLATQQSPSPAIEQASKAIDTPEPTRNPTPEKSMEYILASLDKGHPLEEGDPSINRYRYLLDSLENKTTNTRQQIGDMTVTMKQSARNKFGKELTLLEIMEASNKVIPVGRKMHYAEVSAMVMVTLAQ